MKTTKNQSVYFELPYYSVRNISCPEDLENDRKVYVGHTLVSSITNLPTNENVRGYLLDAEGKERKRPTAVNKAIKNTLENYSDKFCILNSGITIVARECEVDEKVKKIKLLSASIINGSQTQGVIRDFIEEYEGDFVKEYPPTHVKFELIITQDESLIADVSIARNFQDDVKLLSIVGRKGYLVELEESLQEKKPGAKLQTSETQLSKDYTRTERLLQVIAALIPQELWIKEGEYSKVYTYSQKAKCLKDFQEIWEKAHTKVPEDKKYKALYEFYLDIVSEAEDLYNKWKSHQSFKGTGLHAIERKGSKIIDVPDGIVFPILSALSVFAIKKNGHWTIHIPKEFDDRELIRVVKTNYMLIAGSNPNKMGKTQACYSALYEITSLYKKLLDR